MKRYAKLLLLACAFGFTAGLNDMFAIDNSSTVATLWETYYGGTGTDNCVANAVDADGNIYILGETTSNGLSYGSNMYQSTKGGRNDLLLTKFSEDGVRLWTTYWGGTENETAGDIAVDNAGNVIVVGYTSSTISMTDGAYQPAKSSSSDGIIGKFSSTGQLIWATYFGGNGADNLNSVAIDADNNIAVGGNTSSTSGLIPASGSQSTNRGGGQDAFMAKFSSAGALSWATYLGGNAIDFLEQLDFSTDGSIFYTGYSTSTTGFASNTHAGGVYDAVAGKVSSAGVPVWAKYFGGAGMDEAMALDIDNLGNVIISGWTNSQNLPATGFQTTSSGGTYEGFVGKYNDSGDLLWSTYLGGEQSDWIWQVKALSDNTIFVAGRTSSTNNIANNGSQNTIATTDDAFYGFISADGGTYIKGSYVGGNGNEEISAVDAIGETYYIAGTTSSTDLITESSFQTSKSTGDDFFIKKLSSEEITHSLTLSPLSNSSICAGSNISISFSTFGEFETGNSFQVLLSDANGSFINSTVLKTVTASGTQSIKIPATTTIGSNYQIRVVSTAPACKSNTTSEPVNIYEGNTALHAKAYFADRWNGTSQSVLPVTIEFRTGIILSMSSHFANKISSFGTNGELDADLSDIPPGNYFIIFRVPGYLPIAVVGKVAIPNCATNSLSYDFTAATGSCVNGISVLTGYNGDNASPFVVRNGDLDGNQIINSNDAGIVKNSSGMSTSSIPQ